MRGVSVVLQRLRTPLSTGGMGLLLSLGTAVPLWAQGDWPDFPFTDPNAWRGPGGYLNWIKLLLLWLVYLAWVRTNDWVSRDSQRVGVPYSIWTSVMFFPFFLALFGAALTLPMFAVSFPLCLLAYLVPAIVYVVVRNQRLELHERVLTPSHLRHVMAELLGRLGVKVSAQAKAAHEKGAPVNLVALGAKDESQNQANMIAARQSRAYVPAKGLIAAAVDNRAEKIMMDFTAQEVTTRYLVDGVWHEADNHDREEGDGILSVLKTLAALQPQERRGRQQGKLKVEYNGQKLICAITSQGTQTGERVLCGLSAQKIAFKTLAELGMREKMIERWKALMLEHHGFLLVSAMPSGGLSTTLNVSLRSTDRLLRDFIVVEDQADKLEETENVDPITYNAAAGETPDAILDNVLRKQPDVLVVPDLVNAATVKRLCEAAEEDHLIFGCIRAKEAVEALLRVLLLKVPAKSFAPVVRGVLCQRLIRKLCEACKEEYVPPPQLLAKLGIPQGRVEKLFRHPENPEKECTQCQGIGYVGRTSIYELLTVEETVRDALLAQPKLEILRAVARKAGHTTLQEEGLAKVVQGITSLPELMRVMKQ